MFPHYLPEFARTHVHWVHDAIQPSSSLPLLFLPSNFTGTRVFSNELVLPIWWPMYWSFSLTISHFNEYSGLISFRTDWVDLLVVYKKHKKLDFIMYWWIKTLTTIVKYLSVFCFSLKSVLWNNIATPSFFWSVLVVFFSHSYMLPFSALHLRCVSQKQHVFALFKIVSI